MNIFKTKDYPKERLAYHHMKNRCFNSNSKDYPDYGGRGITVSYEFLLPKGVGFHNFISCIGPKPEGKYSLDRIDVNGDYECGNIRWADDKTQARNRRGNRRITYNNKTQTLIEWAEELGMTYSLLSSRINYLKLPFEDAIRPEKAKAGCSGNHTNLTPEEVKDIYKAEEDYMYISKKYSISFTAISRIKNRRRYKEETEGLGDPGRSCKKCNPKS